MKKVKAAGSKVVARPPSTRAMGFRADAKLRAAIIRWVEDQPDKPALPEALRRLVQLGLTVKARKKGTSSDRSAGADAMASDQLDRLADRSASAEEQATRKRQLLKGPEEFREARVDRSKKK